MDGSWYVRTSWGNGVILISCDCIHRLIPLFGGDGEISLKSWRCPHSPTCLSQMVQHIKTGKYSFKRGIITLHFGENIKVFLYSCRRKHVWHIWRNIAYCMYTVSQKNDVKLLPITSPNVNCKFFHWQPWYQLTQVVLENWSLNRCNSSSSSSSI